MKLSNFCKTAFYALSAIAASALTACVDDDADKQAPTLELSETTVAFGGTATEDATVTVRSNRIWTIAYEDEETQTEWMYFKVTGDEVSPGVYNGDGTVKITVGESAQPHMGRLIFTLSNSYGELYRKYLTVTQGNYVAPTQGPVGKLVEYIIGNSKFSSAVGSANATPLDYAETSIEAVILANDAAGNNNRKLYVGDNNGLEKSAIVLYGADFAMSNDPVTKYPVGRKVTLNLANAQYYAFNNVRQLTDVEVVVGDESVELEIPALSIDKFNSGEYQAQYVKINNVTPESSWVGKSWTAESEAQSIVLNDASGKSLTVYMNQGRYATGFADLYIAAKTGAIYGVAETYRENAQLIPTKKSDVEALSSNEAGEDPDPAPGDAEPITIPELLAMSTTSYQVVDATADRTLDAVVTIDKAGGNTTTNTLWVMTEGATTGKNGIMLYSSNSYTNPADASFPFQSGDKVRFTLVSNQAQIYTYKSGAIELTCQTSNNATWLKAEKIGTSTVTPIELSSIDNLSDYLGQVVTVKNAVSPSVSAQWTTAESSGTHTFTVGGSDLTVFVQKAAAAFTGTSFEASTSGDITGYVTIYNQVPQLCPRNAGDVAAFSDGSTPTPEPTPSEGLISNSSDVTAGTYAIVFQHGSNGKYYYLPNDPVIAKNPAGVEVTVTDGKLASPATDDMKWTLTGDNAAGFVVSGNGHYLTSTNTAQGIAVTDTESTQTWNFKDDADNGMLMQSAAVTDARFLSVYLAANGTTATWRYYNVGSSYQGKLYLIAVDGGTSGGDTPGDGKTVAMTAADIIANGSTTITENNYGSQNVSAPATYYTWTIGSTAFGGAKICKATAADYAGLIQMQGNASDAAKQGFFGNSSDLGKITKVVIVSKNTTYEPTEHLYMGTSAYTLNQNAQTRTTLVKDGQIYTETFEIDGDYGFFTVSNDKAGAFYVESVTVYYE